MSYNLYFFIFVSFQGMNYLTNHLWNISLHKKRLTLINLCMRKIVLSLFQEGNGSSQAFLGNQAMTRSAYCICERLVAHTTQYAILYFLFLFSGKEIWKWGGECWTVWVLEIRRGRKEALVKSGRSEGLEFERW